MSSGQEPCRAALDAIVACGGEKSCKKNVEKSYVNCVIVMLCPISAKELLSTDCCKPRSLDLKPGASLMCRNLWTAMDKCLTDATGDQHNKTVLLPRDGFGVPYT